MPAPGTPGGAQGGGERTSPFESVPSKRRQVPIEVAEGQPKGEWEQSWSGAGWVPEAGWKWMGDGGKGPETLGLTETYGG